METTRMEHDEEVAGEWEQVEVEVVCKGGKKKVPGIVHPRVHGVAVTMTNFGTFEITHLPTGMVVECQDDRSQHKNKARALAVLAARIKDKQIRDQQMKTAATRKSLIGSGDRSERIRTYNFPQGRVTDHRINLTLYKIAQVMDGDLFELTDALIAEHQAEQLAQLGEEAPA